MDNLGYDIIITKKKREDFIKRYYRYYSKIKNDKLQVKIMIKREIDLQSSGFTAPKLTTIALNLGHLKKVIDKKLTWHIGQEIGFYEYLAEVINHEVNHIWLEREISGEASDKYDHVSINSRLLGWKG